MPEIYVAVRDLLYCEEVEPRERAAVELVYNTMYGDLDAARNQAKANLAAERAQGSPTLLIFALADLSFVLRRTGPVEEISAALTEAYDIAVRHRLPAAEQEMAARLTAFYFDSDHPAAREWLERAVQANSAANEPSILCTLTEYRARAAIIEHRLSDAQSLMAGKTDMQWLQDRRGWYAASVAIVVRTMIAQHVSVGDLTPYVEALKDLFKFTARLGGQDYEVASLYFGLQYLDQRAVATAYAVDYVRQKRRDRLPLPKEWVQILAEVQSDGRLCLPNETLSGCRPVTRQKRKAMFS
jgi:hypothetical protein